MSEPLVSIVCESFNHEPYLRQCLDGFVMQKTNFPFEILIHDDASTDKSQCIIQEYIDNYPDLDWKPIFQTENQYSKGRSIWIDIQFPRAKGKYIATCEGDDYWTDPLKLQKQVDFLETHPNYSLCYTNYNTVNERSEVIDWQNHSINVARSFVGDNFRELLKGNYIQTMTMLFRAKVTKSIDFQGRIDYALSLACAIMGKCAFLSDSTACYRLHVNSATHTAIDSVREASLAAWEYYVELYLTSKKYRRPAWYHMRVCGTIAACLISKMRSGGRDREQSVRVLKTNPEIMKFMWLGVCLGLRHTFAKQLKKVRSNC